MGKALKSAGYFIDEVYSRTHKSAEKLAKELDSKPVVQLDHIAPNADLYLISVPDNAIGNILSEINVPGRLTVHTSGSLSMNVLQKASKNYGVLYPLQTFSKDKSLDFSNIPMCIEANSAANEKILMRIAGDISQNVKLLNSAQRKTAHVAAVFACNYANFLFGIAEEILREHNLPFELLNPLISETARKVMENQPHTVQTGPAVREDIETMEEHLEMLNDFPEYQKLYSLLAEALIKNHKKKGKE